MSQRHLATRARFDDARPTAANLQKSIAYNEDHAKEHLKAVKEREKDLEKVQKKAGKR
ncbi:MAG: hypothetical protein KGI98_15555 [Euryarchaeota archaeon]|nr:hypothetical protein [Euryarchaeota archaeon]